MCDKKENWDLYCRFCLEKFEVPLKTEENDEIIEKLNHIFNLEIYEEDAWPKRICDCCREKSSDCVTFYWKIKEGEKKLQKIFGEKIQDSEKEIIYPEVLFEVKQEIMEWEDSLNEFETDCESKILTKTKEEKSEYEDVTSEEDDVCEKNSSISSNEQSSSEAKSDNDELDEPTAKAAEQYKVKIEGNQKSTSIKHEPSSSVEKSNNDEPTAKATKAAKTSEEQIDEKKKRTYNRRSRSKNFIPTKKMEAIKKNQDIVKKYLGFKCEICSHEAKDYYRLKVHFQSVHGIKGYLTCCSKQFLSLCKLANHLHLHANPEAFKCTTCSKTFAENGSLRDHEKGCNKGPETYSCVCEICAESFPSNRILYSHRRKKHTTEEEKKHKCTECTRSFLTPSELKTHFMHFHGSNDQSTCDICGKGFRSKYHVNDHKKNVHFKVAQPKLKCDKCGLYYVDKAGLNQHQLRCQKEPVACNQCGMMLANALSLKKHIRNIHSEKKTFNCHLCTKVFSKKSILDDHIAKHSNIAKHECPFCDKNFFNMSTKRAHLRVHHPAEYDAAKPRRNQTPT